MMDSIRNYVFSGIIFVFLLVLAEAFVRFKGEKPYSHTPFEFSTEPNGYLIGDSTLGIGLGLGAFKVNLNGQNYTAHHESGIRINPADTNRNLLGKQIGIFGCSFTYGMGVNDHETLPNQLQNIWTNTVVNNYGVPGHGTIQTLLKLQEIEKLGLIPPQIVLVNYCDFHPERNVLTPNYRIHLKMGFESANPDQQKLMQNSLFPYAVYNPFNTFEIQWDRWSEIYTPIPLRTYSALSNMLQNAREYEAQQKLQPQKTTLEIFKRIADVCKNLETRLIVIGSTESEVTNQMILDLKKAGIESHYLPIPYQDSTFNLQPFDAHPNAYAHQVLAQKIAQAIKL